MSNRFLSADRLPRWLGAGLVAGWMALGAVSVLANAPKPTTDAERAAMSAVRRRIDAFNRHDLAAYLAAHHEDVRIYRYPDRLLGEGRSHLRRIFGPTLNSKVGRVEIRGQFVVNDTVVSNEHLYLKGRSERLIAIYRIVQGKIQSVRLIAHRN